MLLQTHSGVFLYRSLFMFKTGDTLSTIKCPHTNTTQHQRKTEQTDGNVALGNQAFNHLSMGRRWMKLLALALAVSHLSHQLFPRAFLAASKIECHPRPRHIMRKAEPTIFTLLGAASALTTVADFIRKEFVFFQDNLGKVNFLEPGEDTEAHAKKLMDMIVQSGDASTILVRKTISAGTGCQGHKIRAAHLHGFE